jgi:predicted TIM-barrel fold metal-dependent hydrolase
MSFLVAPAISALGSVIAMESKNEFQKVLPNILQGVGNVARSVFDTFLSHHPNLRRNIGHFGYHTRTMHTPHNRHNKGLHR